MLLWSLGRSPYVFISRSTQPDSVDQEDKVSGFLNQPGPLSSLKPSMGASKNQGPLLGSPYEKHHGISESILGPLIVGHPHIECIGALHNRGFGLVKVGEEDEQM